MHPQETPDVVVHIKHHQPETRPPEKNHMHQQASVTKASRHRPPKKPLQWFQQSLLCSHRVFSCMLQPAVIPVSHTTLTPAVAKDVWARMCGQETLSDPRQGNVTARSRVQGCKDQPAVKEGCWQPFTVNMLLPCGLTQAPLCYHGYCHAMNMPHGMKHRRAHGHCHEYMPCRPATPYPWQSSELN